MEKEEAPSSPSGRERSACRCAGLAKRSRVALPASSASCCARSVPMLARTMPQALAARLTRDVNASPAQTAAGRSLSGSVGSRYGAWSWTRTGRS
eukprot:244132-Chlamydomonas_euryale.AAC.26